VDGAVSGNVEDKAVGVKISIGKKPCPWFSKAITPAVTEGAVAPTALVLVRDLTDVDGWQNHVSLACGVAMPAKYGVKWLACEDAEQDYHKPDWEVVAWHDWEVPVDVGRLWWTQAFVEKNLMKHYTTDLYFMQFKSVWEKMPWHTLAPANQYGDQIGFSAVTSAEQALAQSLGDMKKKMKESAAKVPPVPQKFMGMDVVEDKALGPEEWHFQYLNQPVSYNVDLNEGQQLQVVKDWEDAGFLKTMMWPDGKQRSILLAWHFLEGPGNVFYPDEPVLVGSKSKSVYPIVAVVNRAELQNMWEKHAKNVYAYVPPLIFSHHGFSLPHELEYAIQKLAYEMGLPEDTVIIMLAYSELVPWHSSAVLGLNTEVEFLVKMAGGPGQPAYHVKKKIYV
jgi:hypothetical protein